MQFPWVSRKKYDQLKAEYDNLMGCAKKLCTRTIELEDERDGIIGKAADLADIERQDRKRQEEHFEAVLTNINRRKP